MCDAVFQLIRIVIENKFVQTEEITKSNFSFKALAWFRNHNTIQSRSEKKGNRSLLTERFLR
jgi:hypothetical protein